MEEIDKIKALYMNIKTCRDMIAKAQKEINLTKASLWENATGTVDQKKDYIKSQIADKLDIINTAESEIEYNYNMVKVIEYQLEYRDE